MDVLTEGESKLIRKHCYFFFIQQPLATHGSSVADPGCLSRILIFIYPGSNNGTKRGGGKDVYCPTIFCSHKYQKVINNLIFLNRQKKLV